MKQTIGMIIPFMIFSGCGNEGRVPAIDMSNLDTSVSPAEDFYSYATGGWCKNNPLKPEYSRYGTFDVLISNNEKNLNSLFKELSDNPSSQDGSGRKISDLYNMGLDSARLNAEGAAPLQKYISELEEAGDVRTLMEIVARMHKAGDYPFFNAYAAADLIDSGVNVLYLSQAGLGMQDRDYYIDSENEALKAGYVAFLTKILSSAGVSNPEKAAYDALSVEDKIAGISWSSVELRDVQRSYNPVSYEELVKTYPNLFFSDYCKSCGIMPQEKVIVCQPSFFKALDSYLSDTDINVLRNYLCATLVRGACGSLGDEFSDASFDFYSRQMAGIKQQKPRWKRSMAVTNSLLSEAVGELYVSKFFSAKDKDRVLAMVSDIRKALSQHIDSLTWMSAQTKAKAHEKLEAITVKIGYPDKWKDYSDLTIDPALSYYENIRNAVVWATEDNLSRLGNPVDKSLWQMSPQTVNAYYDPTVNEICFPAAILQPPFYNPDADDAVNYGAIGVVISHEMTHGFDDQGRHFDKDGNMNDWWTKEDSEAFKERTDILVKQFDEVEVLPGVHANGALSLGENIADQGGLRIAFTALENRLTGSSAPKEDGFTPQQRFYLAYATLWAQNITDEEIARRTKLDVHSIGRNRVNVSVRNLDSFFEAFDIHEGDAMYRSEEERVVIW